MKKSWLIITSSRLCNAYIHTTVTQICTSLSLNLVRPRQACCHSRDYSHQCGIIHSYRSYPLACVSATLTNRALSSSQYDVMGPKPYEGNTAAQNLPIQAKGTQEFIVHPSLVSSWIWTSCQPHWETPHNAYPKMSMHACMHPKSGIKKQSLKTENIFRPF